jgi:Flp pilus assembly protein TadG
MSRDRDSQRGQSSVEFGASALVLILILFGIIDLGRAFYFAVGLSGATREGARAATWFDPNNTAHPNPSLDDAAIQASVDAILTHSGLPASVLGNAGGTTCPGPSDGNSSYNPPYADAVYPATLNQPVLYICYSNSPGLDLTSVPTDNSYKGTDVNVILVVSLGFVSGFLQGVLGNSIHLVANTHMTVGGY